jgi:hypothetical protein
MFSFLEDEDFAPRTPRKPRKNLRRTSGAKRGEDREFIAWDGEGWTEHVCEDSSKCKNHSGKCKHHYYLFGASSGDYVSARSLSTTDCFDVMVAAKRNNPDAVHVSFSFKYDIDMIMRDIPPAGMRYIMKHNRMKWKGYRLEVLPGKWFQVTKDDTTIRIYDLFSFFACSFVKALEGWHVGTAEQLERIKSGKDLRGSFTLESLEDDVIPYWREELHLLAALAERLREVLYSADIRPAMWHGPGAVANYLFKQYKTDLVMPDYDSIESGVLDAGQVAYAGGRFEAFRIGFYDGPIYSADINSAYPYAMSLLPDMATGTWIHTTGLCDMSELEGIRVGMFHVRYSYSPEWKQRLVYSGFPGTGHYRYPTSGTVHFRHNNPGVWMHLPEFTNLLEQHRLGMVDMDVLEAWLYVDDGTSPFEWVKEIYLQRQEWKRAGNPAQLAAKLGINSLYGKLAQRVGGKDGKPRWHNLEMAGHITSTCRAMLYQASWRQYSDLVAYQTDGIYSTSPLASLPNGAGTNLGQWEVEEYSAMLHLQSGVYWLRDMDGNWLRPKSRGVPQQHMDFQNAMDSLFNKTPLVVEQTQFIRFGLANMRREGLRTWRTWQTNKKDFSFGGESAEQTNIATAGKRIHVKQKCPECAQGIGHHEGLHTLMLAPKGYPRRNGQVTESAPHHLPWRNLGQAVDNKTTVDMLERWGDSDE